ncbi:helix-turn-helix transcriptional regulator [Flavobacteriaceae bacterium]|jgi:DNA-binding HxlR family transcriptional regulator|nr:helix-turn-helix transcriptional regulator [Flavobacteriaceae bacterium]MDA9907623.1 helix-turn-helix transcriptional regulator [Flavobacteriaceae bacterium]
MNKINYTNNDSKPVCACKVSLDLLGDSWSLIIVRDLFRGKNTFSQFLNNVEQISSNILVDRLKKLRALEVINFIKNEKDKKIKEYYLTDRGIDLYPIIFELQLWTINHVSFQESENTKIWGKSTKVQSKEEIIKLYQEKYKNIRADQFGF